MKNNNTIPVFCLQLKELRHTAGLSQKQFALKLCEQANDPKFVAQTTVSHWETLRIPSLKYLKAICQLFNVEFDYFDLTGYRKVDDVESNILGKTYFSRKLTELRTKAGLTKKALAARLTDETGVLFHETYIGEYEHDRKFPTPEKLIALAKFFDIPVKELTGDESHDKYSVSYPSMRARIDYLLRENYMTMDDLVAKLNEDNSKKLYNKGHIERVLDSKVIITLPLLMRMADALGCSMDYILGRTENVKKMTQDTIKAINKIKKDDLIMYHGIPVWIKEEELSTGQYVLVNTESGSFITTSGKKIKIDDYRGIIQTGPSPFELSFVDLSAKPIKLKDIKHDQRVWIEPLGAARFVRDEIVGWYMYNKRMHVFRGDNDIVLPDKAYGMKYIGVEKEE